MLFTNLLCQIFHIRTLVYFHQLNWISSNNGLQIFYVLFIGVTFSLSVEFASTSLAVAAIEINENFRLFNCTAARQREGECVCRTRSWPGQAKRRHTVCPSSLSRVYGHNEIYRARHRQRHLSENDWLIDRAELACLRVFRSSSSKHCSVASVCLSISLSLCLLVCLLSAILLFGVDSRLPGNYYLFLAVFSCRQISLHFFFFGFLFLLWL